MENADILPNLRLRRKGENEEKTSFALLRPGLGFGKMFASFRGGEGCSPDRREGRKTTMKIKSNKTTVKTVTAKRTGAAKKKAAPQAAKAAEKSVSFSVRAEPGKTVYLAGSFNQWNPTGKKMLDKKNEGLYTVSVKLAPGVYEYKFVIDGTWCADPECADWVQNDHGTLNSVITVK